MDADWPVENNVTYDTARAEELVRRANGRGFEKDLTVVVKQILDTYEGVQP